ncbi:MAG: tRNA pseudouridine(55) synthase TruB [Lachnospiraceae bacterium]|nr:tRNA pseudouridine(55) synthase TruB [Lachnospiraceae bacterium]
MSSKIVKDNGLILINKPKDYTSFDVLAVLKKMLHVDKMGHTGTLDKNATGLLVCLVGNSTKYQDYFLNYNKVYDGELVIGLSTDTEDILGDEFSYVDRKDILKKYNDDKDKLYKKLQDVIKKFKGNYSQIPPMYSSKKVNGKRLLSYARQGEILDRDPCDVHIFDIKMNGDIYDKKVGDYDLLAVRIEVECSKGTYIRTLCKDIGEKLGIPCCMGELCRKKTDGFDLKDAYTLDEIKDMIDKGDESFKRLALYNKCNQVVTFGKYDCVHTGHRKIMSNTVGIAKARGYESSVLTFSINPKLLLGAKEDDKDVRSIITKEQRTSYLKLYGIDNIHEFPFDEKTKDMEGEDFVKNILIDQMKAKVIVVGDDCSYGKGGRCKAKDLIETCKKYNVEVKVIDRVRIESELRDEDIKTLKDKGIIKDENDMYVSATLIRKVLAAGEKIIAYQLIGHDIDRTNKAVL